MESLMASLADYPGLSVSHGLASLGRKVIHRGTAPIFDRWGGACKSFGRLVGRIGTIPRQGIRKLANGIAKKSNNVSGPLPKIKLLK
jgi:hypothetical protein